MLQQEGFYNDIIYNIYVNYDFGSKLGCKENDVNDLRNKTKRELPPISSLLE